MSKPNEAVKRAKTALSNVMADLLKAQSELQTAQKTHDILWHGANELVGKHGFQLLLTEKHTDEGKETYYSLWDPATQKTYRIDP